MSTFGAACAAIGVLGLATGACAQTDVLLDVAHPTPDVSAPTLTIEGYPVPSLEGSQNDVVYPDPIQPPPTATSSPALEPSTWILLLSGLGALGLAMRAGRPPPGGGLPIA
jgi:hypothetical protein